MSAPTDVNGKPIVWSNSALQTLQGCGEKFRRRYVEREYTPTRPRLVRGSAVHGTARTMMQQRQETGVLPDLDEVKDLAASAFTAAWTKDEVVLEPGEEAEAGPQAAHDYQLDLTVDLATLYRQIPAPRIVPVGVERRIEVRPKDMDITIAGTIDLIDGQPEGEIIRDAKSAEKSPAKGMADTSEQLTMYGLIRLAEVGTMPSRFTLDYLVRTPAKRDLKYVPLESTRDAEDVRVTVARLNAGIDAVTAGRFVPISGEHWSCDPKWCEFYASCPYTRRGERRPTS